MKATFDITAKNSKLTAYIGVYTNASLSSINFSASASILADGGTYGSQDNDGVIIPNIIDKKYG